MFTAFRDLTPITTPPLKHVFSKLSPSAPLPRLPSAAFRLSFLLLKQLPSELETEVDVILTLLIKLIGGETDGLGG